ncbi:MAG: Ig-like domain-containing protein [Bergeyella sp.]
MKKYLSIFTMFFCVMFCFSQTLSQKIYMDFGPANPGTSNGVGGATANPDANGNNWNNITSATVSATASPLINSNGGSSGLSYRVTDNMVLNTGSQYGPSSWTTVTYPDLAVLRAFSDYFYVSNSDNNPTGQIEFSGFDAGKQYKFYLLASRPASDSRTSVFSLVGAATVNATIASSPAISDNNVFVSEPMSPDANGKIIFNLAFTQTDTQKYGYINIIKIEEYAASSVVDVASVSVSGNDISVSGASSQMTAEVLPANATNKSVTWSISDETVASISATGLLVPKKNGTITVTATSVQKPEISGSKVIAISNQITALYLSGSGTENGDNPAAAIPLHHINGNSGLVTNQFEIYTSLSENGTFKFYTSQDASAETYGGSAGTLELNGSEITSSVTGPVRIFVNLNNNTYTVTSFSWGLVGSTIQGAWSGELPLDYKGNGVWEAALDMDVVNTDTTPRFIFRANGGWSFVYKKVTGTTNNSIISESEGNAYGVAYEDIRQTYGKFIVRLDLQNYTYSVSCQDVSPLKISFMGSSVMYGTGADNLQGYAYQFNELLQQRAANGSPAFFRSNVAVPGDNTTKVMNRFESDLIGDCSSYVVFGLALGNEGVHESGQTAFDSYKNGLLLLIDKAKTAGKIPVVVNNYGRGDFNETDYNFVKQMNLLMHEWEVPSINSLGAVDDGFGKWPSGYQNGTDVLHPNSAGHTEIFYTFVPSVFDALQAGKTRPVYTNSTYVKPAVSNAGELKFTPDNGVHPFTTVFDFKTTGSGKIMNFTTTASDGNLVINANGNIVYTSPTGTTVTSSAVVNDNGWHRVALTHYYARGKSFLYIDGALQGSVDEKMEAKIFALHSNEGPSDISYRNWFFYRSGMNQEEMTALYEEKMLQSSMELYAPLDKQSSNAYENRAQSTNTIDFSGFTPEETLAVTDYQTEKATIFPNPVKDILNIRLSKNETLKSVELYGMNGNLALTAKSENLDVSKLVKGVYIAKVITSKGTSSYKVIKK